MTMYNLPKEFELTEYGESYAADLIEGKMTAAELTTKHRMGLIELDGSFSGIAKMIMFLYKNDYEELYNSHDLENAYNVRGLYNALNGLITLGLGKGDWWSGEDYHEGRVGPGKGQRIKHSRMAQLKASKQGIVEYREEGDAFCEMCQDYAAPSHEHVPQDDEDLIYIKDQAKKRLLWAEQDRIKRQEERERNENR